jgi:hypothetical protein
LAEVSNTPTSAISTAATTRLPFSAKILATATALPHAHFVFVVVLAVPIIVLTVMRLLREMTAVPRFSVHAHHAFAAPIHAVSFSTTATAARPCIGADGKRSDNGSSRKGNDDFSEHCVSQLLPDQDHSARRRCVSSTNAHMRVKCLRAGVYWQIKTPGLVKPGVAVHH